MLNQNQLHHVTIFLKYLAEWCLVPLQVNADCREIRQRGNSSWKNLACLISYGFFVLHSLYKILSLAHGFVITDQEIPLHQTILHMALAGGGAMTTFWFYLFYIEYPGAFAIYASLTLAAKETGSNYPYCISDRF